MRDLLFQFKRDFALLAASCIVLGLLLLLYPETSGTIIAVIISILLAAVGVMHIIFYFFRHFPEDVGRMDLVVGLLCTAGGVYLFLHPGLLIGLLPTVMALLLLFDACLKLQSAADLARMHTPRWWIILLLAILAAGLGIVILCNPFETASILLMFIGGALIADGLFDFWTLFSLHIRMRRLRREMEETQMKAAAIPVEPKE